MIRGNGYIFILTLLFVVVAVGLNAAGFWSAVGLPEPHGFIVQGLLFLAFLFVLKNALFDPYLRTVEAREHETIHKRAGAEKTRTLADQMIEKYRAAIEEARLRAVQERERLALGAEEEERARLGSAKQEGRESLAVALEDLGNQRVRVQRELEGTTSQLAEELVHQVLGVTMPPRSGRVGPAALGAKES